MQRLLSIALSCLFAVTLSAQEPSITYPYNPDSNTDSLIGASDLVDFLPFYGEEFTPEPLTIEGMSVEEWMEQQTSSSGGGCDLQFPDGIGGESLIWWFNTQGDYIVPSGKTFYMFRETWWDGSVIIDGTTTTMGVPAGQPLMIPENGVITNENTEGGFSGYLVDEDYFDDCGGGSVDISGLQEQIDAVAADSYAADAALLTASDNADDELQAQIDSNANISSNGDAGLLAMITANASDDAEESEAGTEADALLLSEMNQNKSEVETEINLLQSGLSDNYTSDVQESIDGANSDAHLQAQINDNAAAVAIVSQVGTEADEALQEQLDVLSEILSLIHFGCTNPTACNYESNANVDDGSCVLPDGCTDTNAINYSETAICDDGSCVSEIGQYYQGGLIGYIDATGLHGLIVSPDIANASWGCYGQLIMGADATEIGEGKQNTIDIINGCSTISAASRCGDLVLNGYSDWFLPSKDELYQLYINRNEIGIESTSIHFSSSEVDANNAWLQSFDLNGSQQSGSKGNVYPVRAVREF